MTDATRTLELAPAGLATELIDALVELPGDATEPTDAQLGRRLRHAIQCES